MVNGGIPGQITDFFTTIAGQATQNLLQKKQQESQRVNELATQLASSGQLGGLPAELQNSFKKTLGNELFETLQFQSGVAQQRQAPVEALRRGAIAQLQAPVTEQVGIEEGPPPSPLPVEGGAPTEVQGPGAPQPIFGERPPTDVEQFERLPDVGPAGAALIGGPQLGQLTATQAQLIAGGLARGAAAKREVTQLIKTAISNNRQILTPVPVATFSSEMVPDGFVPVTVGDQVVMIGAKDPNFKNITDNFLRIQALDDSPADPRDVTTEQSREVLKGKLQEQIAVSAAQGQQAAKLARNTFLDNPLVQNFPDPSFFDKATGEKIPGSTITGDVLDAERAKKVVQLRGAERDQLTELRKGAATINQIMGHVKAIYGPGGALENLQSQGRIPTGIRTGLGRFFQSEPELVAAKRSLDTQVINLARQLRGAKGPLSDRDVSTMEGIIVKLGGIPDTKEIAFKLMQDLQQSANGAAGAILRNPQFKLPSLASLEESQARLVPPEETIDNSANVSPQQVEAITLNLGLPPDQAARVRDFAEANPNTTLQQFQTMIRLMQLPQEIQQAVVAGQITPEQALSQAQPQ